jgi:transposase-like protein
MARPTKRTPDRRAMLLRALRHGDSYAEAARTAGMSPALFRQWRSDDPTWAAEVADTVATTEAQETQRLEALLANLKHEAESRTVEEAMRWLEIHFPNEWGPPERRQNRRHRGT